MEVSKSSKQKFEIDNNTLFPLFRIYIKLILDVFINFHQFIFFF